MTQLNSTQHNTRHHLYQNRKSSVFFDQLQLIIKYKSKTTRKKINKTSNTESYTKEDGKKCKWKLYLCKMMMQKSEKIRVKKAVEFFFSRRYSFKFINISLSIGKTVVFVISSVSSSGTSGRLQEAKNRRRNATKNRNGLRWISHDFVINSFLFELCVWKFRCNVQYVLNGHIP